eukprot:gene3881-14398_t
MRTGDDDKIRNDEGPSVRCPLHRCIACGDGKGTS